MFNRTYSNGFEILCNDLAMIELKLCPQCNREKSLDSFNLRSNGTKQSYCADCQDKYSRKHYKSNKIARKLQVAQWNRDNPEKVKEYKRNWAAKQSKLAQIT